MGKGNGKMEKFQYPGTQLCGQTKLTKAGTTLGTAP